MQGDQNEIRITITGDNRRALAAIRQVIEAQQEAGNAARQAGSNPLVGPTGQPLGQQQEAMRQVATQAPTTARAATALATALERVDQAGQLANATLSQVAYQARASIPAIDAETTSLRQLGAALTAIATNRRALTALGTIGTATGAPGGPGYTPPTTATYPGAAIGPGGGAAPPPLIATPAPIIPTGGVPTPVDPAKIRDATNASNGLNLSLGSIFLRVAQFKLINAVFSDMSAAIGYAAGESVKFQTNMMRIVALTNESKSTVTAWSGEIRKMALEGPSSANELGEALYFVASSGLTGTKALDTLSAANLGARASMGDVADIAKLLTSTMNAYGGAVEGPVQVMDMFTQAAKEGAAEASDYAKHLGAVIPIAAQAGVSLQSLLAFVATGTKMGITTPQAVTGTRAVIENLLAPRKESEQARQELGLTRQQVIEGMQGGLPQFMTELNRRAQERGPSSVEMLDRMIPNIRGLTLALSNIGPDGGDSALEVFDNIGNSAGSTQRATEAFAGSVERSAQRVRASWAELGLAIGEKLNAPLANTLDLLTQILINLGKLPTAPQIGPPPIPLPAGVTNAPSTQQAFFDAIGQWYQSQQGNNQLSPEEQRLNQGRPMPSNRPPVYGPEVPAPVTEVFGGSEIDALAKSFGTAGEGGKEAFLASFDGIGEDAQASLAAQFEALGQEFTPQLASTGEALSSAIAAGIASGAPGVQEATVSLGRIVSDAMGQASIDATMTSEAEAAVRQFNLAILNGANGAEQIVSVTTFAENFKRNLRRQMALDPEGYQKIADDIDRSIMQGFTQKDQSQVDVFRGIISGTTAAQDEKYIQQQQDAERERQKRKAEQDARDAERRTHTAARGFTEAWGDETQRREFQATMGEGGAQAAQRFVDAFANAADFERGAEEKGRAVVASVKALTDKAKQLGIPAWKELGDLVGSAMLSAIEAQIAGSSTADQLKEMALQALQEFSGQIEARQKFSVENVLGGTDFDRIMQSFQAGGGPALGLFNAIDDGLRTEGLSAQRTAQQSVGGILQELSKLRDKHLAVETGREIIRLVAEGIEDGTPDGLEAMRGAVAQLMAAADESRAATERDRSLRDARKTRDRALQDMQGEYARQQAERQATLSETQRQQRQTTMEQRLFEDMRHETGYERETEGISRQYGQEDTEREIQRRESRQMATIQRQVQFQQSMRATQRGYAREDAARRRQEDFEENERRVTGQVLTPEDRAARERKKQFDETERQIQREEAKKEAQLQLQEQTQNERSQQAMQDRMQDQALGRQRAFAATERGIKEQQYQDDLVTQRTFEDLMVEERIDNERRLYDISQYYEELRRADAAARIQENYDDAKQKIMDLYELKTGESDFYKNVLNPDQPNLIDPRIAYAQGGIAGLYENYVNPMLQYQQSVPQSQGENQAEPGSIDDIINRAQRINRGDIHLTIDASNSIILTDAEQEEWLARLQERGLNILATGLSLSGMR